MLCYSRCVRHICVGVNGPITAQLSNGSWQRSGDRLIPPPPLIPYINWPITEGEKPWGGT